MDLGIKGKTALICASSRGLGFGCAQKLAQAGVNIVICARGKQDLDKASKALKSENGDVRAIVSDVTTTEGREAIYATAPKVDILVTNAGGPPPGHWSDWDESDFTSALNANMLAPIALMKNYLPYMIDQKWGRVVNITSQSVKAPIAVLGLSNAARTGLTGYVAGTARDVAKHGIAINNLLPGIHDTDRATSLDTQAAKNGDISVAKARKNREETIPSQRYGTKEEFGAICAFLCSQYAGYIVGQNILADGGNVNSTM